MRQRGVSFIRVLLYLSVPLGVGIATFLYLYSLLLTPPDASDPAPILVEIPPAVSVATAAKILEERGVVKKWWGLTYLSRVRGKDRQINSGEYELNRAMNMVQVLEKLASGEVLKRKVTVKEGATMLEIAKLIEEAGILRQEEFVPALTDPRLLANAGLETESFEGYLFPETYTFSRPVTSQKIIWRMMNEGDGRWTQEFTDKADELGMSRKQVLTLASIIEKESGNMDEQPLISSVFHNRLLAKMKLQSDPTVIYGIPNFNGNLTRDDLLNPHRYNTYVNIGLPPGPICNPGESAIRAALFPMETKYYYFVSNGQGSHIFSSTLEEHNQAVRRYQKDQSTE